MEVLAVLFWVVLLTIYLSLVISDLVMAVKYLRSTTCQGVINESYGIEKVRPLCPGTPVKIKVNDKNEIHEILSDLYLNRTIERLIVLAAITVFIVWTIKYYYY